MKPWNSYYRLLQTQFTDNRLLKIGQKAAHLESLLQNRYHCQVHLTVDNPKLLDPLDRPLHMDSCLSNPSRLCDFRWVSWALSFPKKLGMCNPMPLSFSSDEMVKPRLAMMSWCGWSSQRSPHSNRIFLSLARPPHVFEMYSTYPLGLIPARNLNVLWCL